MLNKIVAIFSGRKKENFCKNMCANWAELGRKFALKEAICKKGKNNKLPTRPCELKKREVNFACKMVQDELLELKAAKNLVDQVDAIGDAIYYLLSISAKNGINLDPIIRTIHRANMRKLANGMVSDTKTGKVLKPDGWVGPEGEISKILEIHNLGFSFNEN